MLLCGFMQPSAFSPQIPQLARRAFSPASAAALHLQEHLDLTHVALLAYPPGPQLLVHDLEKGPSLCTAYLAYHMPCSGPRVHMVDGSEPSNRAHGKKEHPDA